MFERPRMGNQQQSQLMVSRLDNRERSTMTDVTVMSAVVMRPRAAQRMRRTEAIRRADPYPLARIPMPQ